MTACYWPNWSVVFKLSLTVHSLCLISHAFRGWVGEIINTMCWMWQTPGEIGCGSVLFFWSKNFPKEDKKKKVIFWSQNSLKFIHSVITLVMKFHEILMWNKFIDVYSYSIHKIWFIHSFISLIKFHPCSMIEYPWNIICFMDEMGWKLEIKSRSFFFFPLIRFYLWLIRFAQMWGQLYT